MAVTLTANSDWDVLTASSTTHPYASGLTLVSGRTIAFIASWADTAVTATVADTFGNTYTLVDDLTQATGGTGPRRARTFVAKNITGGANYTPTVTYSGATTYRVLGFREISGSDTTTPLVGNDSSGQVGPASGTDAITSTAMTPTANDSLIVGFVAGEFTTSLVAGTGFGSEMLGFGGGGAGVDWLRSEALLQTTATSVAATFTDSVGALVTLTFVMAFQPASGVANTDRQTLVGAQALTGVAPTRVVGVIATPQTP